MSKFHYSLSVTMDKEVWRDVIGYEGIYKVSNYGRVKVLPRTVVCTRKGTTYSYGTSGKYLKQTSNKMGHLWVKFCKDGVYSKVIFVHRLVLETFIGPCPPGMQCRHFPDRNPSNNRLDNLRWGTHRENTDDRVFHDTNMKGERNGSAKLTRDQVNLIKKLGEEDTKTNKRNFRVIEGKKRYYGRTVRVHKKFVEMTGVNISQCAIGEIIRGVAWNT